VIAFYLPQFHPIPENDLWWGRGFTEWTNVVKARPLFRGHYQPHLPADLGFYDLRVPETRQAQADLASQHGITGFCYYHYWFSGRRVLHRPFQEVLRSGRPDFPFCLCWANENWTRRWDGGKGEVLLAQQHSPEDDRRHIEHLLPAFHDPRYIRINGKPLFLVYRTDLLPNPAHTAEIWREAAQRAGLELYLARVESHVANVDPSAIGFDAAVEFAPDWRVLRHPPKWRWDDWDLKARVIHRLRRAGIVSSAYFTHEVYSYRELADRMLSRAEPPYLRFRCVAPGWDNSPRRVVGARILHGAHPDIYERWLRATLRRTHAIPDPEQRIVFVNAWNEWAEGAHLEPDQRWGLAFLQATYRAVSEACALALDDIRAAEARR
jgi:lipopolysaccharide biosynthesis protein